MKRVLIGLLLLLNIVVFAQTKNVQRVTCDVSLSNSVIVVYDTGTTNVFIKTIDTTNIGGEWTEYRYLLNKNLNNFHGGIYQNNGITTVIITIENGGMPVVVYYIELDVFDKLRVDNFINKVKTLL